MRHLVAPLTLLLTAPTWADGRVIITEIMYNPASDEQRGQTEWVEIANVGDAPLEMTDWRLDDEDKGDWSAFTCTLEAGGVAILVNAMAVDEQAFREAWDAPESAEGEEVSSYQIIPVRWGSLANSPSEKNEMLELHDGDGKTVCAVNIQRGGDWPDVGRPDGPSIYLTDLTAEDLSDGKLWKASAEDDGLSRACRTTDIFDGGDIGSPGVVPGIDPKQKTDGNRKKDKGNKIDY